MKFIQVECIDDYCNDYKGLFRAEVIMNKQDYIQILRGLDFTVEIASPDCIDYYMDRDVYLKLKEQQSKGKIPKIIDKILFLIEYYESDVERDTINVEGDEILYEQILCVLNMETFS